MKSPVLYAIIIIFNFTSSSGNYDESYLESILEKIAIETGSTPVIDEIEKFIEKPLSLKTATVEELLQVPGFSTSTARLILELTQYSEVSYNDIDSELNLTDEQMYILQLCTTLEKPDKTAKSKHLYIRLRNQNQFQSQKGFETDSFKGTSLNIYQKSSLYYKNISAGFLFDKDPGEYFVTNFSSGFITGKVLNTNFIIGDYFIENGMGSILWKSYGLRKGVESVSPVLQVGSGIKPYSSSLDYNYFRGMACQSNWKFSRSAVLSSILWASYSPRSANIDSSGKYATSLYTSGYYRTENEIEKKNTINEKSIGGNLELQLPSLKFGITSFFIDYSKEITSKAKSAFSGKSGILSSAYFFLFFDNSSYSAEVSSDSKGNLSTKASAQYKFGDFEMAFHYRFFNAGFRSPYGYNLGESGSPANETGLYSALMWKIMKNMNWSLYADLYKNLSATQYLPLPNKGIDVFTEFDYDIFSTTKLRLRLKNELSTDSYKNDSDLYVSYKKNVSRVRLDLLQLITKNLRLFLRGEIVYVSSFDIYPDEKGYLTFADVSWKPSNQITIGARLSYFSTDSYGSAVWQFEPVMPGYFLTSPLYGKGLKIIAYAGITPIDEITFNIRFSLLTKNNAESLGSGYNEIKGNTDSRLILQLDVRI